MDEKEILELLGDRRQAYNEAMRIVAKRSEAWSVRRQFYIGDHYGKPKRLGRDEFLPKDPHVAKEKIQKCRNIARTAAMRYMQNWPSLDLYPSRPGTIGQYMAHNMKAMAKAWQRTGVIAYKTVYTAALDANIIGSSWLKVQWDPYAGKRTGTNPPFQGDIRWRYVSSYDVAVDPRATTEEDARFICHRRAIPLETFRDRFKQDIFGRPVGAVEFWNSNPSNAYPGNYDDVRMTGSGNDSDSLVEVAEMWVRPTNQFPNGVLMVFTGGTILALPMDDQGMPELPYEDPWNLVNGVNLVPGLLYADGPLEDALNLQKVLNHTVTKQREAVNWAATPALMVPNQAEINGNQITDVAGKILRFRHPFEPKWMMGPGPTQGMSAFTNEIAEHIRDVSGQAEAAQGITSSANASGKLLNIQNEFNLGLMWPEIAIFRNVLQNCYTKSFKLAGARYDENRIVHLLGPDGKSLVARYFSAEDFDTEAGFQTDPTSQETNSRALKFSEAQEALAAGAFADTPDGERFRKVTGEYWDDMDARDPTPEHHARADREGVALLLMGQLPMLAPQDDDAVHLLSHERTSVSPEFFDLPPEIQQGFLTHMQQHQSQQMMKQGGAPQTPGQPPEQPPPPAQPGMPGSPGSPPGSSSPENGGQPALGSTTEMGQS